MLMPLVRAAPLRSGRPKGSPIHHGTSARTSAHCHTPGRHSGGPQTERGGRHMSATYDRLVAAVTGRTDDAGIRFTTRFSPAGGPGARVMPPTYAGGKYLTAERLLDGGEPVSTVLLDSFQSQANRVEEALLDARDEGRINLPLFELRMDVGPWTL